MSELPKFDQGESLSEAEKQRLHMIDLLNMALAEVESGETEGLILISRRNTGQIQLGIGGMRPTEALGTLIALEKTIMRIGNLG